MSDSTSAFQIIINHAPALLLLDIGMPDLSASELLAELEGAGVPTLPIVLMTTEPAQIKSLLVGNERGCLAKPFDLGNVLTCVERYVRPLDVGCISRTWRLCCSFALIGSGGIAPSLTTR